ncbi:DNA polymerase [Fasciolopsis buskii]|uniref:DNA-directed DNA polymerase n=1 Tax=Fasciolopsis buskii TaxID=27845 RepID=A0A8E0VGZ4_9TREM|nr:DNA polymerase [Fasciolopsis buski]
MSSPTSIDAFCIPSHPRYVVRRPYPELRYDPELLVGYDVERASWGYLVNRAACFQRQSFPRELSRLAPAVRIFCRFADQTVFIGTDIIECACCSRLIKECGNLIPGTHTETNRASCPDNCSCSCGAAARFPDGDKHQHHCNRGWPAGTGAGRTGGPFPCPGRVVLCLWRVLMSEISLFEYSLETVVLRLLKETVPRFSGAQLHTWFAGNGISERWRTVDYFVYRSLVNLRLISCIDLVGRTSEFARIFGIEFYHVLSRGSQYRVESLLGRTARAANFLLPSPSVAQRARQRAPEAIPLNLEPDSSLFVDGPVAVLDFQSLYPSVIIAYNYCYSTVLGRLTSLGRGEGNSFDLGCLSHWVPAGVIEVNLHT